MRLASLAVTLAVLAPSVAGAAGYVNAGYVNAGYVNAGYVNAGYVNAGYVNAGYVNAGYVNAGYVNGGAIGGFNLPPMKTAQGQPIDSVVLERDYLTGYAWVWELDHWQSNPFSAVNAWHYRKVEKLDFIGATFDATVNDAASDALAGYVVMKISSIKTTTGANNQLYYQHVVEWQDAQTSAYAPVCGCENGSSPCTAGVPATLVQGAWNYTQGTIDGGAKISNDPNQVTVACAQAAISKCASDKSTLSPITPTSLTSVAPAAATWIHKGSVPVYKGTTLSVKLTNVTGDPDLYVKWNGQATAASWTCRPYAGAGAAETCTLAVPDTASTAYVSVYGYSASSAKLEIKATGQVARGMGYKNYGSMTCSFNGSAWTCSTSPTYELQSCTRMVTADYCGDGTPHTITGRPIEVYDLFNPNVNAIDPDSEIFQFESQWTPQGASSLGTCRVNDMDFSEADPKKCPVYGNYQHQVATYKMLTNQYGQEIGCAMDVNNPVVQDVPGYLYNFNDGTFYPAQR